LNNHYLGISVLCYIFCESSLKELEWAIKASIIRKRYQITMIDLKGGSGGENIPKKRGF